MMNEFQLKLLLIYKQECKGFTPKESIEYLQLRAKDISEYLSPAMKKHQCAEHKIKMLLFKDRFGNDSIPVRMSLLMEGMFVNFDNVDKEEKEKIDTFNSRWDEMWK